MAISPNKYTFQSPAIYVCQWGLFKRQLVQKQFAQSTSPKYIYTTYKACHNKVLGSLCKLGRCRKINNSILALKTETIGNWLRIYLHFRSVFMIKSNLSENCIDRLFWSQILSNVYHRDREVEVELKGDSL